MTVVWTGRALRSLDAIVARIALDNETAAEGVRSFVVTTGNLLDIFPHARGQPVARTAMREVLEQRWKRYALRFIVAPGDTVVIVDVRRIRPFPPRYLVP